MSRISMSRCRAACASANIRSWPQRSHVTFINQDGNALNGWSSACLPVGSGSSLSIRHCRGGALNAPI
jgi:hypothetical protein